MMTYCNNNGSNVTGNGAGSGGAVSNSSPSPQIPCSGSTTPPAASGGPPNGGGSSGSATTDPDDDIWRGHSIAALRRRASELNAAIPSYLQINYDTQHNASGSVY